MKQTAGQLSRSTKVPSSHASAGPSTIAFPQHPCPAGQSAASRHCVPLPVHRPMAWQFELQSEAQRFPTEQFAVPVSQVSPKSLVPSPQHPKVGQSSGWFVGSQFGVGRRSRGQSFVDVHAGPVAWLVASRQRPEPLTVDVVVVDVVVVVASVVDVLVVDVEVVVGNVVDDGVVVDVVVVARVVVVVVVGPALVVVVVVVLVVVVEPGRLVVVVVVGRVTVVVVVVGAGHTKICPSMASSCVRSASRKADCAPASRQVGQPPFAISFAAAASYLPVAVLRHVASSNALPLNAASAASVLHLPIAPQSFARSLPTPSEHLSPSADDGTDPASSPLGSIGVPEDVSQ